MCAARATKLRERLDKEAKERQREHGNTAPGKSKTLPAGRPELIPKAGDSRDHIGHLFGVSGRTVERATKVSRKKRVGPCGPTLFRRH
jgi:hypothetical protein